MRKIKIGIPRAFTYHRYSVLWKSFFETLGCKIILSPETNREIIDLGINNTIDECCLSYKIYIGHVMYLKDKCDYLLVARICDYGKKDKVCTRFNGTYDNIRYLLSSKEIISYNIDYTHYHYELLEFFKMGLRITHNPFKIIYSYITAKSKQKKYDINKENEEKNKITKSNKKILIISHFYNLNDRFISNYILSYIENNNLTPLLSSNLNKSLATSFAEYFSDTIYWKYSKEIIGALYYYRHQIDGIIFISTYPCGIDSLVNNLAIAKNKHLPILNLIIDENINEVMLETKLESFIDIVKGVTYE